MLQEVLEFLRLSHTEECDGELLTPFCDPYEFYMALSVVVGTICIAGMMAGLTMGLLSLDKLNLQILQLEGSDVEKERASRVLPLIQRHHRLLVTLLLFNAAANEALPVFLARLVPETQAIVISVTSVLLFGEILPSAVFTGKSQLAIAAGFVPFVELLMALAFPLAYPISKMLDWCVGEDHDVTRYKRKELKALVALQKEARPLPSRGSMLSFSPSKNAMKARRSAAIYSAVADPGMNHDSDPDEGHQPHATHLHTDEVTIIHGALDLTAKTVRDVMVPWSEVFMLDEDCRLTKDCLAHILSSGHSRIPVYRHHRVNVVGLLLVKRLIVLDPSDARPIRELMLKKPIVVSPDFSCYAVLNEFQKGRSHMALITPQVGYVQHCWVTGVQLDGSDVDFVGIVTIEDVVEELIQEEIQDETDRYRVDANARRFAAQTRGLRKCATRLSAWASRARRRVQLRRAKSVKRMSITPRVPMLKRHSVDHVVAGGEVHSVSVPSPTWAITIPTEASPLLSRKPPK
ncbi:hypothetical protein H310_11697 [Aphanomyces invadans]|uniref:CNNM transmembrane domain-containing protein n=1 Tax=Aphanomyces invadans TaxID=157072 RepID=A0A024TKQ0_9STRA|nr:hypothetical protein H310_11697 [Aphanomyces invadans]ETV94730.1 hypothetical protein H310_11697 [Aphanomyces invadans]|eukprot:XP_008876675.1 hypothetical protein H310_11697 [Aphanomyces invadans]